MRSSSLSVLGLLINYCWAASALPAAGTVDAPTLAKRAASAHALALAAQISAQKAADAVTPLAAQHKPLSAALGTERAAFTKHLHAAQTAYPPHAASAKPSTKPAPLPKLESLLTAKTEGEAAVQASSAALKSEAALHANEAQLELLAEAAADAAANAKSAAQETQDSATLLVAQAKPAGATAAAKAAADLAQTQEKEAKAAATSAASAAGKARASAGTASKAAFAARQAADARGDEQAKQQQATLQSSLREVDAALALQNPAVPGCDLHKVPWQSMTYPWFVYGGFKQPLTLKDNVRVCDETEPDGCTGPPAIAARETDQTPSPLFGDMDGDGKPEAALELITFCCDVSGFEVLFFKLDPQCHLRYLGSASDIANAQGALVNGAYVIDMPWARPGENLGLGAVTGVEHAEWRLVNGQIKKTVSVKKKAPPAK